MKQILLFTFIVAMVFACDTNNKSQDVNNVAHLEEKALPESGECLSLFEGKAKAGWHVYHNNSDGSAWEVNDGVLHLNPNEILVTPVQGAGNLSRAAKGGDLAADEEYDNFHLQQGWNSMEVVSENSRLEVIINGRSLYATTLWDVNWRDMIARTKSTFWPDFGTYKTGKIVLQDHGHPVWYRNIKIKRLLMTY